MGRPAKANALQPFVQGAGLKNAKNAHIDGDRRVAASPSLAFFSCRIKRQ